MQKQEREENHCPNDLFLHILHHRCYKMNNLLRTTTIIFGAAFFPIVIASSSTSTAKSTNTQPQSMLFQVIQSQMRFDSSTVDSATLDENASNEHVLHLKLKTLLPVN